MYRYWLLSLLFVSLSWVGDELDNWVGNRVGYTLNKNTITTLIKQSDWIKTTHNCRVMGCVWEFFLYPYNTYIYIYISNAFCRQPIYSPYQVYNYLYVVHINSKYVRYRALYGRYYMSIVSVFLFRVLAYLKLLVIIKSIPSSLCTNYKSLCFQDYHMTLSWMFGKNWRIAIQNCIFPHNTLQSNYMWEKYRQLFVCAFFVSHISLLIFNRIANSNREHVSLM